MKNGKITGQKKILLILLLIAAVLSAVIFANKYSDRGQTVNAEGALVITDLDVGKADAAIIRYKDSTGLIDTGEEDDFVTIDTWLKDHEITAIDYMILSHFDKDHIGSAVQILENYPVKAVYYPDYISSKKFYKPLMEELSIEKEGRSVTAVSKKQSFQIVDLKVDLIPAEKPEELISDKDNMDNNMSLLCLLNFGSRKFYFTGDCEKDRLQQLIDGPDDLSADWIKIPHHGGFEDNEKEFLEKVDPKYAVISNGIERKTEKALLKCLKKRKTEYLMTIDGDIETICDGNAISMNHTQNHPSSFCETLTNLFQNTK